MNWFPKRSVVVPIDFSEESLAALDVARALVEEPRYVHAIHVLPLLEPTEPGVIWATIDNAGRRHHAEEALKAKLAEHALAGASTHIAFGDPGHEVASYAQNVAAELIVLPSHGRTGLARLLIGSTAEKIVRLAHCPVLVLRK